MGKVMIKILQSSVVDLNYFYLRYL